MSLSMLGPPNSRACSACLTESEIESLSAVILLCDKNTDDKAGSTSDENADDNIEGWEQNPAEVKPKGLGLGLA
ncbi:hypothetical protein [Shewanella violacea]|uniref:hypothetical protein n=1 Tax=Shewanella violacea TaxID=60217 RepID=UPI0012F89C9B|nr:hypothetical protein [Shewanella violacea]